MSPREVLAELSYPVRSLTPVLALLVFGLLITLASHAGLLGLWLLIVVVPAMFRFLVMLAESIFPPIPSELIIPFAGFAAANGDLNLFGVLATATQLQERTVLHHRYAVRHGQAADQVRELLLLVVRQIESGRGFGAQLLVQCFASTHQFLLRHGVTGKTVASGLRYGLGA